MPPPSSSGSAGAEGRNLRPESYPPLPDFEAGADEYNPHPDGRPWRKACDVCAFRISDPQDLGDNYQRSVRAGSEGTAFYCFHNNDGEHQRICACWAAVRETERRLANAEGR